MKTQSWIFAPVKTIILLLTLMIPLFSCDDDDNNNNNPRTFTITVTNVSDATTLQVGAMPDRTAPISPGLWAIFDSGTLFDVGQPASLGTQRLAEEGMPEIKTSEIAAADWVDQHGEFSAPGGINGPVIGAGESATFTFEARPDQKLQIMTMFGQSNDWFYAFGNGGLDLFNGNDAVSGDVSSKIVLYDAGTELDEMPGLGLTQKPDHPTTIDVGPVDPVNFIQAAVVRHPTFIIPPTTGVIRVTVSSVE